MAAPSLIGISCQKEAPPAPRRPNVLLLSLDGLRADRLGAYGNQRATSPTIDRLAEEGVRFAHASSPTSWTLPSHVTLLTGLRQREHQVVRVTDKLRDELESLPEVFQRAGYETMGMYSGPFLDPGYGFDQGFDHYISCAIHDESEDSRAGPIQRAMNDRTNPAIEKAFAEWAGQPHQRPFFAFVHMWDVHYDYIPPEPYWSMFDPDYHGELDGRNIAFDGFPDTASQRDVDFLRALYDAEIRYTDATIAQMIETLEAGGLLDDTLIVLTSDHGDEFREHGGKGHGATLFEEVVHVPLIFWAPGRLPRGEVVERPVELSEVAPTIAEIAGVPFPSAERRSLLPLMRGEAGEAQPVFSELYKSLPRRSGLLMTTARLGNQKVTYDLRTQRWQSYDLQKDPGERDPQTTGADTDSLHRMLAEFTREAEAEAARRSSNDRQAPAAAQVPAKVKERLRQLGYLED